jgi:hypothetical protein
LLGFIATDYKTAHALIDRGRCKTMPVMGIAGNGKKDIARKNFARVNANPGKQTILISAQKFTVLFSSLSIQVLPDPFIRATYLVFLGLRSASL